MTNSEWYTTTLGECAGLISGGTPSKQKSEYWGGTIPWVSAKDMKQFRLYQTEDYITEKGAENGTRIVPAGTILILVRGMTLHNDIPICIIKTDMAFNQDVKAIQPNPVLVDVDYLAYYLLANKPYLMSLVDSASHGTGRINTDILKAVQIELPPLPEQKAIAHILGTLDDKIELNREMNRTLEAMARAIFKSWFVDFDPVRAKMEGRLPTGMDAATAELFPDEFEESALGMIPKGWRVGRLDDLLVLQRGFDLPTSQRVPGKYPVIAASGPSGTHAEYKVKGPGVTTGRSGLLGKVFFVHEDFWPLNTSLWVKEFKNSRPIFAYHLLSKLEFESFNAGSAVPTLNRNHVHGLPEIVPPMAIVEVFENLVISMFRKYRANEKQSANLASIRDTLLPKLLSGEIRIKEAEKLVEIVA